ncbi:MAG: alpha/beta hydrolase [Kiritimatiellia bacterium]
MKLHAMISVSMMACAAWAASDASTFTAEIWPKGRIPLARADAVPEGVEPFRDDIVRLTNVSVPAVVVTKVPSATKPTPAVVICPGGGYGILAWNLEGVEIAQWLKGLGITGVILKYRVPDQRDAALADAQRAIRWVRAHAAELNIDPTHVGIMGFSAGANLTVRTATNHKKPTYAPVDDVDKESCRPDFQMPIYPWDLLERNDPATPWKGHKGMEIRQAEYPVDGDTPRAFIVQSEDDFCLPETSLAYYAALKRAKVPVEMHLYEQGGHGGHGYGIRYLGFPTDGWPRNAEIWLQRICK